MDVRGKLKLKDVAAGTTTNFLTKEADGTVSFTTGGYSGYSGYSGYNGTLGGDGDSGYSGTSGYSGYSGNYSTTVEAADSGHTILTADAFTTFTCNSTSTQTFDLPSVGAGELGYEYTIVKLGSGAVVIHVADSDTIEDSGAGATIYCQDDGMATITLKLISTTQWIIKFANGVWITTV
jgi:hypothetical protein